ncbi:MAG: NAD(P)/FAD-dependent oxidoreductase [Oscillospiraceae bacterium]|nr:NAD(P)/FAD-dependent oxidoreductase [Oscillospiraceae bacterium]
MKEFDVLVVGGGAAGLMAAGTAAERGLGTLLLERNARVARKLMITGKGRCNVTNACTMLNELIEAVPVNGRFLYSAFSRFMPVDTMEFFEARGVPLKVERGNRVFPESDKAADIVDALDSFAKKSGAQRLQARVTELIAENGGVRGVRTEDGREFFAKAVIVATGGVSYPLTGSTGDGYALAKQAGHSIREPEPSLVPLEIKEDWCRELQGLALKNVALTVRDKERYTEIFQDFGEMLFTHFGVSGPIVLSASSHMRDIKREKYELEIDLKPALRFEQLDARIQRDIAKHANKAVVNALVELLPRAMIPVVLRLCDIPFEKKANQITREQRQELALCLKRLPLTVTGFRPIEEAIVTSGGVTVSEISPRTMESKLCRGLFFAGEVLDADAYTGGYNLQIAFSTGVLAGRSVCAE